MAAPTPTAQWKEMCATVTVQMRLVMMPFVTPLVRNDEDGPTYIGSGGYVETDDHKLLLTNDHVFRKGLGHLTHKFYDCDQFFTFAKAFISELLPTDLAASPVDLTWFPVHRFAVEHAPVEKELLFMLGFAGQRAYYSPTFNIVVTNGTPYLSQEFDPTVEGREIKSEGFDRQYHFAIPWEPDQFSVVDEDKNTVPLRPEGFSGSFVWNTRFTEFTSAERPWDPAVAQLTGVVWGWSSNDRVLLATRIEHVRNFLLRIPAVQ